MLVQAPAIEAPKYGSSPTELRWLSRVMSPLVSGRLCYVCHADGTFNLNLVAPSRV